jgi:hypothetical protein
MVGIKSIKGFNIMDISKYAAFFHDGSIIDIKHIGDQITILMESAEMEEKDMQDNITLTKDNRIKGKLHIEGVKCIKINNEKNLKLIKKIHDEGGIFNFEITKNSVVLSVDWVNFPPKPKVNEFSVIKIEAEKIWWENIPDLEVSK